MASITVDTGSSWQGSWDSIVTVMSNLGGSAASFMLVVQAFAYAAGIFFLGMGIVMMTKTWNPQARGAYANASTSGWFWSMATGILLFALPETMAVIASTMFDGLGDTSPLAYARFVQGGNLAVGNCKLGGIRPLLVVFGFIAVIRGIIILRTVGMYGSHSRGNASASRGFILCGAGLALVHMHDIVLPAINKVTGLSLGAGLC